MDRRKLFVGTFYVAALSGCQGFLGRKAEVAGDSVDSDSSVVFSSVDFSDIRYQPPTLFTTELTEESGTWVRRFAGQAAPQNLEFLNRADGTWVKVHDFYPNSADPFKINPNLTLGPGGFNLAIEDRAQAGIVPDSNLIPWALNMIPFGVAIDGVILDPSGPWFDGGPADPNNPFDRQCSGWEYDPLFPIIGDLLGVVGAVGGHTQPSGLFHYHSYPKLMIANLKKSLEGTAQQNQPLLLGFSADGYPIYDCMIPAAATQKKKKIYFFSAYVLREGARQALPNTNPRLVPPGNYDGTYVQDFEYNPQKKMALIQSELRTRGSYRSMRAAEIASGAAEFRLLDRCNGFFDAELILPEFPQPVYAYVLTEDWPQIPRLLNFKPSESFRNNIIPLDARRGPGRTAFYDACGTEDPHEVHKLKGRERY